MATKSPIPPLDRLPYFVWGSALMAIKYNLDRLIAHYGFHRSWYFWNYINPHGLSAIQVTPPDDWRFFYVLLLTSLPFLAAGLFLTLRRLRSAGLPLILCVLFVVPLLNLVLFAGLSVMPARIIGPAPGIPGRLPWLPTSVVGSALLSVAAVGSFGLGLACLSTVVLRNYGSALFISLPFAMGLVSVLIYAGRAPRSLGSCLLVSILPVLFVGAGMLILAVEGIVCLLMAAPIGILLALVGGLVGHAILGRSRTSLHPVAMSLILLSVPFSMGMERQSDETPPLLAVTSTMVIDAPPERVWPNVISFSTIPEKRDWVLHTGIAYPTRARIDGTGPGAVRHCIFTTGEFVEPIEVWEPNRLLRFSVARQPEPIEELSPYPHLKTPHLDGYFQTHQGELKLMPLPGGKTLLSGTTWYTDRIWPGAYWKLWSDLIIHHIHLRVMGHIKALSESSDSI
jgi:uncharacterized membrane protein YhaH (DUF805 family)